MILSSICSYVHQDTDPSFRYATTTQSCGHHRAYLDKVAHCTRGSSAAFFAEDDGRADIIWSLLGGLPKFLWWLQGGADGEGGFDALNELKYLGSAAANDRTAFSTKQCWVGQRPKQSPLARLRLRQRKRHEHALPS